MQRADSLEKILMLGKIEGKSRRQQQRMRRLDGITDSMDIEQTLGDGEGQRSLTCCSPWGCKELEMTEGPNNKNSQEQGSDPPISLMCLKLLGHLMCFHSSVK